MVDILKTGLNLVLNDVLEVKDIIGKIKEESAILK